MGSVESVDVPGSYQRMGKDVLWEIIFAVKLQ
jgi:hypothetical protein